MIGEPSLKGLCRDELFRQAEELIDKSGASDILSASAARRRGDGGRPAAGITYNLRAVLIATTCVLLIRGVPTVAAIQDFLLRWATDSQLARVDMTLTANDRNRITERVANNAEYKRFNNWLNRQLVSLDSGWDLPAQRVTNGQDRETIARRSRSDRIQSAMAERLTRIVVNRIIAASIIDPAPDGYYGDVVVDETTFDVAAVTPGMGVKNDKTRSAVSFAGLYVRQGGVIVDGAGERSSGGGITKMGHGVGVTALTMVGQPGSIRKVPPMVTAVDLHRPTSGSVGPVDNAFAHHTLNGFDPRTTRHRGKNARLPMITSDMGYNVKNGYAEMLIRRGYEMIARYPTSWQVLSVASDNASRSTPGQTLPVVEPGPVMFGDALCPMVRQYLQDTIAVGSRSLKGRAAWIAHDRRLAAILPLLMARSRRVHVGSTVMGRPAKHARRVKEYVGEFGCPAELLRQVNPVACTLKPESIVKNPTVVPLRPTWKASDKRCCAQSRITLSLTAQQLKTHQRAMFPGSWEHIFLYEAYRALTERRFSHTKSPYVTRLDKLNFGARREPMIKLIIALSIAVGNIRLREGAQPQEVDTFTERMAALERRLGHPPTRLPTRT